MKLRISCHKKGLTIIELICSMAILAFLALSITLVFRACFKAFNAGTDRTQIRTPLSQAMQLMSRDLYNIQSISGCTSTALNFYSGSTNVNWYDSNGLLYGTTRAVKATGVTTPGTSIFNCATNLVSTDISATNNGESIRLAGAVMPRNPAVWGLINYWKFDDHSSGACSAGSGTATDSSGNSNTGTCTNSPTWITGYLDYALSFNGSNNYVLSSSFGTPPQSISVSLWINSGTAGGVVLSELGQAAVNSSWHDSQIEVETNGTVKTCVWIGSVSCVSATGSLTFNKWHHIVLTYDVSTHTLKGYYDGSLGASSVVTKTYPGTLYYAIAAGDSTNAGNGNYFNGYVDDVRFYNRALSSAEVLQLYNGYLSV